MIIVLKKRNVLLFILVFVLILAVYGLNVNTYETASVTRKQDVQRLILIDPGHGGEDPGAVSSYSGIKEKDINLKIAFFLKGVLEKEGYSSL